MCRCMLCDLAFNGLGVWQVGEAELEVGGVVVGGAEDVGVAEDDVDVDGDLVLLFGLGSAAKGAFGVLEDVVQLVGLEGGGNLRRHV